MPVAPRHADASDALTDTEWRELLAVLSEPLLLIPTDGPNLPALLDRVHALLNGVRRDQE
jgi:hypothetical protein